LRDYGISALGCVVSGEDQGGYYKSYGPSQDQSVLSKGIAASRSTSAM
jgi:hypothetical protein